MNLKKPIKNTKAALQMLKNILKMILPIKSIWNILFTIFLKLLRNIKSIKDAQLIG